MARINKHGKWVFDNLLETAEFVAGKPKKDWTEVEYIAICRLLAEHTVNTSKIYRLLDVIGRGDGLGF